MITTQSSEPSLDYVIDFLTYFLYDVYMRLVERQYWVYVYRLYGIAILSTGSTRIWFCNRCGSSFIFRFNTNHEHCEL